MKRANLSKRYLTLMCMSVVPALSGCLWESIHVDGVLDAQKVKEELPRKEEESLNSEDDTNEDSKKQ